MLKPTQAQLSRAGQLLAAEGGDGGDVGARAAAAGRVFDKIDAQLTPVLGPASVQALLQRSLKLAQGELPSAAKALSFESSSKLREGLLALDPAAATVAMTVVFGTFFGLITTFIGERLTIQMLRRAWPALGETEPGETKQ